MKERAELNLYSNILAQEIFREKYQYKIEIKNRMINAPQSQQRFEK